jgi:mannose-6-phosphate isomerase-like protein (cupin superfamily)
MESMTKLNTSFRTAIWTGKHLQVTVMSLQPGEDIGVEMHPDVDQFVRIEAGDGIVEMGTSRDNLSFNQPVTDDDAIIIPAGAWHNVSNTGDIVMKAYSIYAPPSHPYGTKQQTRAEEDVMENG